MTFSMLWCVMFLFIVPFDAASESSILTREKRQSNLTPDKFLEQFGYLNERKANEGSHSDADIREAVKDFQRMVGLNVTGILDRATFKKMKDPRCGVKDVLSPKDRRQGRNKPSDLRSGPTPLPYYTLGLKWPTKSLTWTIVGTSRYSPRITRSQYRRSFINAFNKWQAVTPLTIRETTSNKADILINFYRGDHRDGSRFDGRGGTLAHAFFPGSSAISGDTHFDDDEQWTLGTKEGTNLEIVAAHEFGHALGLSHSNVPTALMAPYYQGYDPNYELHDDDIRGIQSLYGSRPRATPRPRTTTRRPRPTTKRPKTTKRPPTTRRPTTGTGDICRLKFDGIYRERDGYVYAVRGKLIYKFKWGLRGIQPGFPKKTRSLYRRAPKSPNAIIGNRDGRVYMFKGGKIFLYKNFQLVSGYPKKLYVGKDFFRKVNAGFQWSDGRMYVFKGDKFSVWEERFRTPPSGYPRTIASYWRGIPVNVEASVRYNGYSYFFKGMNYFKFDDRRRTKIQGFPRPKAAEWLGC